MIRMDLIADAAASIGIEAAEYRRRLREHAFTEARALSEVERAAVLERLVMTDPAAVLRAVEHLRSRARTAPQRAEVSRG